MRLVQISHPNRGRRVAIVDEPWLRLLCDCRSVYELAQRAIQSKQSLSACVEPLETGEQEDYDAVYSGQSDWRLLSPIDHPEPSRCFVTGTGLTHKGSAENRQSMHVGADVKQSSVTNRQSEPPVAQTLTDSMKMFQLGLEGGRPPAGSIGTAPEWFYKGVGTILRAHNQVLEVPPHALDGGDEAEIAGIYLIGPDGTPYRIGLAQGNEFSDHVLESQNYLYLATSKLRDCALGPELVIDPKFDDVPGRVTIERGGKIIWEAAQASGERWMCHTLANLEHHHFKHAEHRRPGDVHIHFFGADMFSFKDRLRLEDRDVMSISFEGFGRALRNPVRIDCSKEQLITVKSI
ncbi:MAG TPA: AraD1 family protein [Lacipirellulaceae bacterium]|nr:AraD1 family protein [Lacipirellulaceae bacterium]